MSEFLTDLKQTKFEKAMRAPSLVRPGVLRQRNFSVTWDEAVINAHDSERGTRQEISEPPTPYPRYQEPPPPALMEYNEEDFGSLPASALGNRETSTRTMRFRSLSTSSDEKSSDSDREEEKRKKAKFEALRKTHYNHKMNLKRNVEEHEDEIKAENVLESEEPKNSPTTKVCHNRKK